MHFHTCVSGKGGHSKNLPAMFVCGGQAADIPTVAWQMRIMSLQRWKQIAAEILLKGALNRMF